MFNIYQTRPPDSTFCVQESERMDQQEHFFECPFCGEEISFLLDLSIPSQSYIEDCEVCCRPIEIRYTVIDGEVADFQAQGT